MAKDKTAQQLAITIPGQLITRDGTHVLTDKNGNVTFKYKKPRSSKMVTETFAAENVVYVSTSANSGDKIGYISNRRIDLGEVEKHKLLDTGFFECSTAAGKITAKPTYVEMSAESDPDSSDKPKKKKSDKKKSEKKK